jgi:hypothetical protein
MAFLHRGSFEDDLPSFEASLLGVIPADPSGSHRSNLLRHTNFFRLLDFATRTGSEGKARLSRKKAIRKLLRVLEPVTRGQVIPSQERLEKIQIC